MFFGLFCSIFSFSRPMAFPDGDFMVILIPESMTLGKMTGESIVVKEENDANKHFLHWLSGFYPSKHRFYNYSHTEFIILKCF